ncbi:MAG: hypothetical protein V3S64_08230 [bacterium]
MHRRVASFRQGETPRLIHTVERFASQRSQQEYPHISYIRIVPREEAEGPLKEIYERLIASSGGRLPLVLQSMSLHPDAIDAVIEWGDTITFGGSTLGRVREELLATTVAVLNDCDY